MLMKAAEGNRIDSEFMSRKEFIKEYIEGGFKISMEEYSDKL